MSTLKPKMSEVFELPVTTLGLAYNTAIRPHASDKEVIDAMVIAVNAHDALVAALEWYADTFCEHTADFEGCGKMSIDDCSGCKARAALALAEGRS